MNRIIATILAVASIFGFGFSFDSPLTGLYPSAGRVVEINEDFDLVTVQDANGFLWGFYGAFDYEIGDNVAMIMNGMGTELVFDDEVVMVKYAGEY